MSYDVTFAYAPETPEYPDERWRNYTSNVSRMWADAIGEDLGELIERYAVDGWASNSFLIGPLHEGVAAMEANPDKYRAMNPDNGWGDYDGALAYLRWMLAMAEAVPNGVVSVSR